MPDMSLHYSHFGALDVQRRADQNMDFRLYDLNIFEKIITAIFETLMILNKTFCKNVTILVVYSEERVEARHRISCSNF